MANVNFEKATVETLGNIWVVISRKKRTKDELYTYVCKDAPEAALARMAEEGNVFVTTFPMERLLEYINPELSFTGRNGKLFGTNLNRLKSVGYETDVESIATAFENLINCLVEEDSNGETMAEDDDWSVAYKFTDEDGGIFDLGIVNDAEEEEPEEEEEEESDPEEEENDEEEEA